MEPVAGEVNKRYDNFPLGIYPPMSAQHFSPPAAWHVRPPPGWPPCCAALQILAGSFPLDKPVYAPSLVFLPIAFFPSSLSLPSSVCPSTLLSESASPNTR